MGLVPSAVAACRARGERYAPSDLSPPDGAALSPELFAHGQPAKSCPQEDILGTVNLGRERIGATLVRMNFKHQAMMRLLDLGGAGAGLETEDGESLLRRHRARGVPSGAIGPRGS